MSDGGYYWQDGVSVNYDKCPLCGEEYVVYTPRHDSSNFESYECDNKHVWAVIVGFKYSPESNSQV